MLSEQQLTDLLINPDKIHDLVLSWLFESLSDMQDKLERIKENENNNQV